MIIIQRHLTKRFKPSRFVTSANNLSTKNDGTDSDDVKHHEGVDREKKEFNSKKDVTSKLNDLLQMMVQKDREQPSKQIKIPQATKPKIEKPVKEKPLGEKLANAAKEVATSLGGDEQKTESELLNILLRQSETSTQILKDVLEGMKVDKTPASRAEQIRKTLDERPTASHAAPTQIKQDKRIVRKKIGAEVDILGAAPSSFFTNLQPVPPPCELKTWQSCVQRDMRLATTHPPSNIYEQMIQWTDRGMLWHFPIDNEQGLDDEKQVSFEEHIFLENHLEGWCPEKGPVRHFMELVCVGLSKNHWLSAEEKKTHIYWFRDYFAEKQKLLKEIGAGAISIDVKEQKEITT